MCSSVHFVSHQLCTSLSGKFFQFFSSEWTQFTHFNFFSQFPFPKCRAHWRNEIKKGTSYNARCEWFQSMHHLTCLVLSCFVSIQLKSTEQHQECQSVLLCIHAVKSQICAQFKISQRDRLILCLCKRCQDWNWLAFYFHISDFICIATFSLPCYRIE